MEIGQAITKLLHLPFLDQSGASRWDKRLEQCEACGVLSEQTISTSHPPCGLAGYPAFFHPMAFFSEKSPGLPAEAFKNIAVISK
jgi:hypothetical protein